jgi:tRNA A-37 threonylcarbamoyl transferase component Bud32
MEKPNARTMFMKVVAAVHAPQEIEMQMIASSLGFAPKIRKIFKEPVEWTILMDNLDGGKMLSDIYGENADDIPEDVWNKIRKMIETLYFDYEIEYVDVTPYNFMERDGKIWMIDFGDARYAKTDVEMDWYLEDFLDGENYWNPDFR